LRHTYPVGTEKDDLVHEVLDRIADKWTLVVIDVLENGLLRFTEIRRRVPGISQKMLTKTLRQMERDGLVTRRVHPVIPPHVDYELTRLGMSLGEAVCSVWKWVDRHMGDVAKARRAFDARK
jgi:DNA-binding HxlR family transcriptional regulator